MFEIKKGDGFGNETKGPFASNDSRLGIQQEPLEDPMDTARKVFTKGRFEFMGGPITYRQCEGVPGCEDNNRIRAYPVSQVTYRDAATEALGVDIQE